MSIPATEFLKQVLGEDGQKALEKAERRVPTIGAVLVPRAIISWLTTAVRVNYEGGVPGLDNSYLALHKTSQGFSGHLAVDDSGIHAFGGATDIMTVAACIAVALGVETVRLDPGLKGTDISKLGKSIDLLVKARVLTTTIGDDLAKSFASPVFSVLKNQELPGKAAAPKEPEEAQGPEIPMAVAPSTNSKKKLQKTKELVVKKSDAERACAECGLTQFRRDRFVGCMCFRALAKSVDTKPHAEGYKLTLSWDEDAIEAFMQVLKG